MEGNKTAERMEEERMRTRYKLNLAEDPESSEMM